MYLSRDDLITIATGPTGQGDALIKMVESELVSYKRQVGFYLVNCYLVNHYAFVNLC